MEQDNSGNINNRYLYMMMLWYPDYISNNNSLYNINSLYNNNYIYNNDNDNDTELMNTVLNISMNDYMSKYKNIISEEGMTQLKYIKYTFNRNNNFYNKSCPIMMYDFEENQEIIQLPCNHCYDPVAIKKWVNEEKAECPVCRYKLKSKEIKIECNNSNNSNYFDNYTNNELNEIRTYITDYLLEEQQYRDNIYSSLARIILGEDLENDNEEDMYN